MEEASDEHNVVPELYFLIAKFLCGGPLKETAKTLLKELDSVEVLPRRLDWEGAQHTQSYQELAAQYSDISWQRLAVVCERALRLARVAPSLVQGSEAQSAAISADQSRLTARLSLLSETLVRPKPKYSFFKQDHSLVRRLVHRELGLGGAAAVGGRGGEAAFPARLLGGLQLQRRTLGHLSAVYCVVFDCTGRYVVTGADDLLVKVWVARDGRLAATLRGCGAEVTDVCVSRDGALLAVGSVERLVRVWCLATGAPRAVLHAHAGTITSVHWSPATRGEVRWLASTSTDGSVAFWSSSADGQFLSQPVQYVERMRPGACHMICAAWSAGGAFLAAGSADQHVRVYALNHTAPTPRRVLEVAVHGDAVDSIAWAHRGLRFVSGSKDGCAALWTLHATQWRHVMLVPDDKQRAADGKRLKVTMVCWDCSDAYVVTAVSDNTVRVWCSRTCTQVRCLNGHRDEAYVLEAHPFLPAVLLSAGHDGQLFVWDAAAGEVLAQFHNRIEGQGDGAIFDAKWGNGATIAATDSHGHLLLLGLGRGHRLLSELPIELFFHTDYRPLVRDALGGALDEQTETPPHLMPPPFLVDVEGAPHAPRFQRLVPGRENLALSQLIPAADAPRSRIDAMIAELVGGGGDGPGGLGGAGGEARGVWRGEGVRHTAGSWQRGDPLLVPHSTRPIVPPLAPAARRALEQASAELNALEMSWYRREMRRRPVMISTATESAGGRRRPGPRARAPRAARPPPRPLPLRVEDELPESASHSDTSDESVRLSPSVHSSRDRSSFASSLDLTDSSSTSSDSSEYSDWETGAALAPPARSRRRPLPARRYSPSTSTSKRSEQPSTSTAVDGAGASESAEPPRPEPDDGEGEASGSGAGAGAATNELPDVYRPGEWLTAVAPRKAPYHPQMGDVCLYFRLGHQRYFEAVAVKDLYKINPRDKPWERTQVHECELAKVVGVRYEIKPPRVASVRLACALDAGRPRSLTVRYHDMPDVIDFLVLRQQYDAAVARRWGAGDRFRCMIDDSWWSGVVLERCPAAPRDPDADARPSAADSAAERFSREAASHFLSLRVRWDNGEVERLSPWDLEPVDPAREPTEPGGSVAVLPRELETALYRAEAHEWPPRGNRAAACHAIANHIEQVMSLSVAEPFVAPVDLQLYPSYARVVPYPIDLATIKARFENLFYRRAAAAQFDVRYLATNAELFNVARSPIVRQARLLTDLLLHIISHWHEVDVVAKYHELAASYQSSDDEPLASARKSRRGARRRSGGPEGGGERAGDRWRGACADVLNSLLASADAEPFLAPVSEAQAPDYARVVARPMDLGTVGARLATRRYASREQFVADVRQVFANSRLYNTNKRSRIYSMTVRLSSLFEALWARVPAARARATRGARGSRGPRVARSGRSSPRRTRRRTHRTHHTRRAAAAAAELANGHESASSDSETLAATSRRVHRAAADAVADDSIDSDAPLNVHRKGKGVGKKSKSSSASAEPTPSTSRMRDNDLYVPPMRRACAGGSGGGGGGGGAGSWSESSAYSNIEVVEEELAEDEVELTYDEHSDGHRTSAARPRRKRARITSDSSVGGRGHSRRSDTTPLKRMRERFTANTTTSGSSSGSELDGERARRYESDHSYRPRYSTDDDAPLNLYRQRQGASGSGAGSAPAADEPGTSGTAAARREHNGHARLNCGGVSLRARSPVRYNEDSEEDSAAAISKRAQRPHRAHRPPRTLAELRAQGGVGGGAGLSGVGAAVVVHNDDHNYFNGHTSSHHHRTTVGPRSNGVRSGGEGSSGGAVPVSISSRGRVRKLTAKARGLLRD